MTPPPPLPRPTSQYSFAGLGVLLLDYLATRADGYCDEVTVCEDSRLSQKQVRRALKHLEDAGLVRCDVVKYSLARDREPSDDPEVAARRRVETHAFWAVDYPRVKDALRLRLALMREALRKQVRWGRPTLESEGGGRAWLHGDPVGLPGHLGALDPSSPLCATAG